MEINKISSSLNGSSFRMKTSEKGQFSKSKRKVNDPDPSQFFPLDPHKIKWILSTGRKNEKMNLLPAYP